MELLWLHFHVMGGEDNALGISPPGSGSSAPQQLRAREIKNNPEAASDLCWLPADLQGCQELSACSVKSELIVCIES